MHSESNFKDFKQDLYDLFEKENKNLEAECESYIRKRALEQELDSKKYYDKHSKIDEKKLEEKRREKSLEIDIKYKQEHNHLLKESSKKIKDELERYFDKNFEEYAKCFITHLLNSYENGEIETYKKFNGIDKFNITTCEKKQVIFKKDNEILKLDVDSILKEYDELIKQEISKSIFN